MLKQAQEDVVVAEDGGVVGKEAKEQAHEEGFKVAACEVALQQGFVQLGYLLGGAAVGFGFFNDGGLFA